MADLTIAIKIATEDASSGPIGKIKGALGGLGEAVAAPGKALGGLVSGLGSLGLAAAGVGAAFDAVKGAGSLLGIGALNEMEQTRASFQAFTKDSAKTEEILAQVRKEAALTPFAFGEMAKATASLLPVSKASGAGLQDLVKQAEVLAASNPLEGLEGASFSLREAMTGDFTSIIERFNLSRSTINKLKEEGVPNLEIVRKAMAEMGFDSDLIAAKAETLDGRWSTFMDTLQTLQMRMGQPIFDAMKDGLSALQPLLDDNMATFEAWADSIAGAIKGVIEFAKTGFAGLVDLWGSLRENFEAGGFGGLLSMVTDSLGPKLASALENLGTLIATTVEEWATSFAAWVDGASDGQMSKLGEMAIAVEDWLLKTALVIVEKLGVWAGAFVDWIAPKIPPMLEALGGYLAELAGWMLGTALPLILTKLGEWGLAFVEWVVPRIPPLLLALGELLVKLSFWIADVALPAIIEKLGEWAVAFVKWVPGAIIDLLFELGKLEVEFIGWIAGKVKDVATAAVDLGKGLVQGIQDGIAGALTGFWSWLQTSFVEKIPETIRKILNLQADTGALAMVGARMVEELKIGINNAWPSLEELWERLGVGLAGGSGSALIQQIGLIAAGIGGPDFARAAMAISASETGGGRLLSEVGGTGAQGPFQFDPGGELRNFATFLHTTVAEAGAISRSQPMLAAKWALEGYLGDALRAGLARGLTGASLAVYGSRVGQRPRAGLEERAGEWYRDLFPGFATGGIAWQPQLAYVAEREPELIMPLSRVRSGQAGGGGFTREDLDYLADRIGRVVSATRPINLVATAEDQARKIRRELDGEARRMQAHYPIRGGRS